MKKNGAETNNNKNKKTYIEKTLDSILGGRRSPGWVFFTLLLLYILGTAIVQIATGSTKHFHIAGYELPVSTFTGVFSAFGNICLVLIAVYCGKKGFITALAVTLIQMPVIIRDIIINHNLGILPGVFGNVLTIIAVTVVYFSNKRVDRYQNNLREQAVTDLLTGLPNRFACSELLDALIEKGERFVIVSIDINGFKSINDTLGFDTGNNVLCEIASRWKTIADTGLSGTLDFITRISGDEFVLIIRGYNSDEDIRNTIKQYEAVTHNRMTIDNCDLYISASFGYAEFPADSESKDSVISCADAAMHEVKRKNSSDHILRFSPDMLRTERTLELERKLREALDNEDVFFHLQPQFDMSHKLRGFEALARMKDKDGAFISPGEFIPVAEEVGLIDKVDGMVFRKAAEFFGELIAKTGTDITLSVNVSVRHLMKNDFLDEIRETLRVSGVPARQLEIEITESIMIDSVDKALRCIEELEKMDIRIAIDDFGTGYSSLSYLNKFPADLLKIDKSFIDKMDSGESSRQYVAAIISIGHIMGFDVISEGVESEEQLETLRSIGCDYIQGFIWGRPLPKEEAEKLVTVEAK